VPAYFFDSIALVRGCSNQNRLFGQASLNSKLRRTPRTDLICLIGMKV
jgi:hypothetical protein